MSWKLERNDRKSVGMGDRSPPPRRRSATSGSRSDGRDWIWGWHAVEAALANPARPSASRLVATKDRAVRLTGQHGLEILDPTDLDRLLPANAVHQGVALLVGPPAPIALIDIASPASGTLIMLDQVTDPQNVGAIFRSAAAFGAKAVILQARNSPSLTGSVAKAAAGTIDRVPHVQTINLSRTLEQLADLGWRAIGLDGSATLALEAALDGGPTVLVLGSEGSGLRRLVSEHCDVIAKIPMPGGAESLNVSAAAAIALYEASRPRAESEAAIQAR